MKKTQNNFWFTLVELIVVITILAILWTIAFISLQWYSAQARDSKRVSDIQNIKKSLELFSLNIWKYPEPDSYFTVKYWSQDLRYQWIVWDQVSTNLSRNLNEKPTDPLTGSEYTYSRTFAWTEYEVLWLYESDLISVTSPQPSPTGEGARPLVVSSSFASNSNYPKINGNYNGIYVKAGIYYLPTPSIINGNIWWNIDLEVDTTALESQVITGGDNVPLTSTWWLTWMTVEVFSWELDTTKWRDEWGNKELLAQALIDAYSWTTLANEWVYQEIVETESDDYVSLVDDFVLNNDNFVNNSSGGNWWWNTILNPYISCTWENIPISFSATTTYPWCDTADIIVCSWIWTWYTISACNLWTTISWTGAISYWDLYQFGKSDTSWINWNSSWGYDWKSPGWIDAWSANLWWVEESEKTTATYVNQNSIDKIKMQWPCAIWYHVPTNAEWVWLYTAWWWENNWVSMQTELKLPYSGARNWSSGWLVNQGSKGFYWSSSPNGSLVYRLCFDSNGIISTNYFARGNGFSIRCFKN